MAVMTYLEAISAGLREAMRRDERVFLIGEDIGVFGGAFKVTKGFIDEFGPQRVVDAPLAETAIVGSAIGAAVMGMRPVVEMQFADFVTDAFTQVVNMAAKFHYRNDWCVPVVIRMPYGGGLRAGPYHSSCMEAWFVHTPGLKVVTPATPEDAKGLLLAGIRDDNPVMYFEHKHLYRHVRGEVPDGYYETPIGEAAVRRQGSHLSLFTYGWMVHLALQAAHRAAGEGIEVEVVDLRSLAPMDKEAIAASVARTGKALVVHEATKTGGVGGEIAAFIAEECFESLDGPVVRVASVDTPVPHSPVLEDAFLPGVESIAAAIRKLAAY
ncbi:MAG: alpha-ketoacid dehydrogenase subunit beta [Armatimonadetes bacterium]|nr:alpha-ketoacid dehydrogenase subunit beta [Armatimonadota bacterium]